MEQIGISDIQRNLHKLDGFDIVEIIDKKRGRVKGYFVDKKHAQAIQKLIKQQQKTKTSSSKLAGALQFYSNTDLIEKESGVWEKHISKKYQQ